MARRSVSIPVSKQTLGDKRYVRKAFQAMIADAAGKLLEDILMADGINFSEPLKVTPEIADDPASQVITVRVTIDYTSLGAGQSDPFAYPSPTSMGVRIGDRNYPIMAGVDDGLYARPRRIEAKTSNPSHELQIVRPTPKAIEQ